VIAAGYVPADLENGANQHVTVAAYAAAATLGPWAMVLTRNCPEWPKGRSWMGCIAGVITLSFSNPICVRLSAHLQRDYYLVRRVCWGLSVQPQTGEAVL
jgi:hypothetical protein